MGIFGRKEKAAKEHTDPVCGMVIVEEKAVGPDTIQGEVVWYCSTACQDQYHERSGIRRSRRDEALSRREAKHEETVVR